MAHMSFKEWVDLPITGVGGGGRSSIWLNLNGVIEMSEQFLKIMRPIMMKAYQCIKPGGLTYCYPDLMNAVQIHQDSVFVPDPQDIRITAHSDYHEIIESLKNMVEAAVQKEPPPHTLPDVVDRFIATCNNALNCFDIDKLGRYSFFITLNPIIYDLNEWYDFLLKTWHIYNVNQKAFESSISLDNYNEFPNAILQNQASSFFKVYTYAARKKYGNQSLAFILRKSRKNYYKKSIMRYIGDLLRHYNRRATQLEIVLEVRRVLPGLVPVIFEEMVRTCSIDETKIPSIIFGMVPNLSNERSLYSRMNEWPIVIRHNNWDFVQSKIRP